MDINKRLEELNITLPTAPPRAGAYAPAKEFGDGLVFLSGCGPAFVGETEPLQGTLGKDFTVEEGQEYAEKCALNLLAVLKDNIGDLNRVKNVVKILVLVASTDDFTQQPAVANGASELFVDIFGEDVGLPSRSAVGVNVLPGGIPVEIEAIFEIE